MDKLNNTEDGKICNPFNDIVPLRNYWQKNVIYLHNYSQCKIYFIQIHTKKAFHQNILLNNIFNVTMYIYTA